MKGKFIEGFLKKAKLSAKQQAENIFDNMLNLAITKHYFKFILAVFAFLFVAVPVQAADHYVWSNREYRFWIDDTTIETNASRTLATFDLVCENLIKHTSDRGGSTIIFYKDKNQYYVTIGEITKPVNYYDGWWQPYGLAWLQDNNFLQ